MNSLACYGPNLWSTERPSSFHLHCDAVKQAIPSLQLGCLRQKASHVAWPRVPGKLLMGLEARRHAPIACDADQGPLVINGSSSQQMALLHLLLQEPAAKPAVTLERLRSQMGSWPALCALPPNVWIFLQFTISSLFTYPHQGLGWIQQ